MEKTYAKPTLKGFQPSEEVAISLSNTETLTVEIPDAYFAPYSNARLTLGEGSTRPTPVGVFTPLTEGEEGTPLKDVTMPLTNADLTDYIGKDLTDYIDKLVELRYEVSYESGDPDTSEPLMLRISA